MVMKERKCCSSVMVDKKGKTTTTTTTSYSIIMKQKILLKSYASFAALFFTSIWLILQWKMLFHLGHLGHHLGHTVLYRNQRIHHVSWEADEIDLVNKRIGLLERDVKTIQNQDKDDMSPTIRTRFEKIQKRDKGDESDRSDDEDDSTEAIIVESNEPPKETQKRQVQKKDKKFIIFHPIQVGQGAGNKMAGLLAAHLLAVEFDRIVCVSQEFEMFHRAFEPIHPEVLQFCPEFLLKEKENSTKTPENSFSLINFNEAPDECELRESLQSDVEACFITANTYPRWPKVPDSFFFTYYRAKPALLDFLPYDQHSPPEIVVHLRIGDKNEDHRNGLDNETLQGLGRMLPQNSSTFLVTNNVVWFDEMEQQFGWAHPDWASVKHTASDILWGTRNNIKNKDTSDVRKQGNQRAVGRQLQILELFSDWYTILTAKQVYHTFSDFSTSAIHWMNIDSKVINGYDSSKNKVVLDEEYFRQPNGESPRLVDRTESELQHCSTPWREHGRLTEIDDRIKRLRGELVDAELEKESFLRQRHQAENSQA